MRENKGNCKKTLFCSNNVLNNKNTNKQNMSRNYKLNSTINLMK